MQLTYGNHWARFDYQNWWLSRTLIAMGTYGDEFNAAVASELRAERGRSKITVDALAAASGFSKSAVLNYLNNKRDIPTPAFVELCKALGVQPRTIFERAEQTL